MRNFRGVELMEYRENEDDSLRLIKRVKQIANEVDKDYIDEGDAMSIDTLAFRLKIIAANYSCYILSWTAVSNEETYGAAECFSEGEYEEEEEDTWEIISADNEPMAIIVAFKWLADRGYFA